jgi:hypothetical protein
MKTTNCTPSDNTLSTTSTSPDLASMGMVLSILSGATPSPPPCSFVNWLMRALYQTYPVALSPEDFASKGTTPPSSPESLET